jgi:hypothetical protein
MRHLLLLVLASCAPPLARVPDAPTDGGQRVSFVSDVSSPFRVDRIDLFVDGARVGGDGVTDLRPLRDGTHVVAAHVAVSLPCTLGEEPREKIHLRLVRYIETRGAFEARVSFETPGAPLVAFESRPRLALAVAGGANIEKPVMKRGESLPIPDQCLALAGSPRILCAAWDELRVAVDRKDLVAARCAAERFSQMRETEDDDAIRRLAERACIAHDPVQPGDAREIAACPLPEL